ncbi:imelysin family protein [Flavobacteriaceae bacterium TP-CH-4]|uniref:Imelysin family protein n=1 Tax=Pelagihabitans pacificus TaxID=2696054 RepID=A0A967AWF3_9FLAO|nr:imelysin family protein [Pelagihabitans pacificus]NHF57866.1 imelysin family protein [Pelagihabitans pacificus]
MNRIVLLTLFSMAILACSSDNGEETPPVDGKPDDPKEVTFERSTLLVNWADNIIIPSYEAFVTDLDGLNSAFETFRPDASTENLLALRNAWLAAYKSWQWVSMFEIGPAENVGLRLNINTYPTNIDRIEQNIVSTGYDLSLPSNREAKGFPALDYLINGLGESDEAIVSKYNEVDRDALISYIEAVLNDMTTLSKEVLASWKDGYRDSFIANDGSSATASVDRFVNDYIFYYEKFLRAGKMGIPLGVFSGSALPDKLEAYYKGDASNVLFLEGLSAVQDFFNGKHFGKSSSGESLASYLDALNELKNGEDLTDLINGQFDKAREMVSALDPFLEELENNAVPTQMSLAYDEVQRAVPLLKVDMVSAMSISIDFVDADGD